MQLDMNVIIMYQQDYFVQLVGDMVGMILFWPIFLRQNKTRNRIDRLMDRRRNHSKFKEEKKNQRRECWMVRGTVDGVAVT